MAHTHDGIGGRLNETILDRLLDYGDRIVSLAEFLQRSRRSARVVEQLIGSGTSAGANLFEASEAFSLKDFRKCASISVKELSETRYWLRFIARRKWVTEARVSSLLQETIELLRITKAMVIRSTPRRGPR